MKKWEYAYELMSDRRAHTKRGGDGWEMVTTQGDTAIFKRELIVHSVDHALVERIKGYYPQIAPDQIEGIVLRLGLTVV